MSKRFFSYIKYKYFSLVLGGIKSFIAILEQSEYFYTNFCGFEFFLRNLGPPEINFREGRSLTDGSPSQWFKVNF